MSRRITSWSLPFLKKQNVELYEKKELRLIDKNMELQFALATQQIELLRKQLEIELSCHVQSNNRFATSKTSHPSLSGSTTSSVGTYYSKQEPTHPSARSRQH